MCCVVVQGAMLLKLLCTLPYDVPFPPSCFSGVPHTRLFSTFPAFHPLFPTHTLTATNTLLPTRPPTHSPMT